MSARDRTIQSHRFLLTALAFLLAWQVGALLGVGRSAEVVLGALGFVFHVIFAKAYTLVPSYFDRDLAVPRAPTVQLPLTALGVVGLALAVLPANPVTNVLGPRAVGTVGAVLWALGVVVFVAALGWTVRDNLTGAETATSENKAERRRVDRFANAFVPVVLGYLLVGSYELLAAYTPLPGLLDGYLPREAHLLAAGAAALLIFAVGFRLLPRFLVAYPPRPLVYLVLPLGALGPAFIAVGLPAGSLLQVGAALEATAVLGFGAAYAWLFVTSDRRRVGFYAVLVAVVAGALAVLFGIHFALDGLSGPLVLAHARLNLLGFLGLTIVGVTYQFYPPNAGRFRGANDRTALATIALLGGGLAVEVVGLVAGAGVVVTVGDLLALAGALGYAALIAGLLRQMRARNRSR